MQQQPMLKQQTTQFSNTNSNGSTALDAAYGGTPGDALEMAKKRVASETGFTETSAKKSTNNTVRVVLDDDEDDNGPTTTANQQQQQQRQLARQQQQARTVVEASQSVIDTKFDWRFLTTSEQIAFVIKIADSLSKNGDYLNVNPVSANYTAKFGQQVDCGWNFQFQTPPMVCTTGLRNSEKYPGQWSALLAGSENFDLTTRLGMSPEVANHMAFLRALANFLNSHLVEHGEEIFLNTARRVDEENAKTLAKNPQAKVTNPYRQNTFVAKGKNDPMFGQLWETGKYSKEKYAAEVQPLIGTFFVAYEDKQPSVQVRVYPKNVNGVRDNNTPDVVILNEDGQVEAFDPNAPYCQSGHTSWEALLKVSVKWYDGMFRLYLNMRSFRYYLNNGGGASEASGAIIFSDPDGNKRRVIA